MMIVINKFALLFLMFGMANDNENTHDFNGSNISLSTYLTTSTNGHKFSKRVVKIIDNREATCKMFYLLIIQLQ